MAGCKNNQSLVIEFLQTCRISFILVIFSGIKLSALKEKKRVNNFDEADRSDAKTNIPAYYPLAAATPNLNQTLISWAPEVGKQVALLR